MEDRSKQTALLHVAFVGETLGPLFSEDPLQGNAGTIYKSLASLDVSQAACEWPFCPTPEARDSLRLMQQGIAQGIDAIAIEYRRLFIGPSKKVAPPWGSVYTDREGVLFGESALDLHEWMSEHTISTAVDDAMPDDHIGRMLSLMAWIARRCPDILPEYLGNHLLPWAPRFLERLSAQTRHSFFAGVSTLALWSLRGIESELDVQVRHVRLYR